MFSKISDTLNQQKQPVNNGGYNDPDGAQSELS